LFGVSVYAVASAAEKRETSSSQKKVEREICRGDQKNQKSTVPRYSLPAAGEIVADIREKKKVVSRQDLRSRGGGPEGISDRGREDRCQGRKVDRSEERSAMIVERGFAEGERERERR